MPFDPDTYLRNTTPVQTTAADEPSNTFNPDKYLESHGVSQSKSADETTSAAFAMDPLAEFAGNSQTLPGLVSGTLGLAGDTLQALSNAASWAEGKLSKHGLFPKKTAAKDIQASAAGKDQLATSAQIQDYLQGAPKTQTEADQRAILHTIGNVFGPDAAESLMRAAARTLSTVPAVSRVVAATPGAILPGTFGRVTKEVRALAPDIESGAPSELDSAISELINSRKSALKTARSKRAKSLLDEVAAQSADTIHGEQRVARVSRHIQNFLANHFIENAGSLTPEQEKLYQKAAELTSPIRELKNPLTGRAVKAPVNLEGIDNARRLLNEIASGEMEGYDAVTMKRAGDLARNITAIMRENIPAYGKYLEGYKSLSEPLNLFEGPEGKRFTRSTSEFDVTPKYVAGVSKAMFSSPTSYKRFSAMIGNPQIVDTLSRNKMANDLIAITTDKSYQEGANAVDRWIRRNEWINDADPAIKQTAERYSKTLHRVAKIRTGTIDSIAAAALVWYGHTVWGIRALLSMGQ